MDDKSYECPCCGQEFIPESGVSPEEHLARGYLQVYADNQKAYFDHGGQKCPRCGIHHLNAVLEQNAISTEYTARDVYICHCCCEEQKNKSIALYNWRIMNSFLAALSGSLSVPPSKECSRFMPQKDNPYPLCDNKKCALTFVCQKSANMNEEPYYKN